VNKVKLWVPVLVSSFLILWVVVRPPGVNECTFYSMGGILTEVKVYGAASGVIDPACEEIKGLFEEYEALLSNYRDGSLISRINRGELGRDVVVPLELASLIGESLRISKVTAGYFDITVLPLIELWKEGSKSGKLPTREQIERRKRVVGYQLLQIDRQKSVLHLDRSGIKLDLGAIAKGYMIDRAADVLKKHGVVRGLVNSGGDIVVFDLSPEPSPFTVAIYNPEDPEHPGTHEMTNGSIVTSGNYNRAYLIEGKSYSHIINPHTGSPEQGCHSITVEAPNGTIADAYATALCLMGDTDATRAMARQDNAEIIEFKKQEF